MSSAPYEAVGLVTCGGACDVWWGLWGLLRVTAQGLQLIDAMLLTAWMPASYISVHITKINIIRINNRIHDIRRNTSGEDMNE